VEPPPKGAFQDLVALAACFLGLVGLIAAILALKAEPLSVPRPLFLGLLALACAPFYLALLRPVNPLFLLPSIIAVFLLYPIANPHGFVYSRDPIFNFEAARTVIESGQWIPGAGAVFARTYSYYPVGNVFLGATTAGLPGEAAYLWAEPLVRLLALPAAVYSIGRRLFDSRVGVIALLFYLGTGSILFNLPVQQGMGVIFVALALLSLCILSTSRGPGRRGLFVLFILSAAAIVVTHHLSSYVFAIWLGGMAALSFLPRNREALRPLHLGPLFAVYGAVLFVYAALLTAPLVLRQTSSVEGVIANLLDPADVPSKPIILGRTFTTLEIAWLGMSILILVLFALVAIRKIGQLPERRFAWTCGLVAALLVIVTLPGIATSLNFVPLRISEFTNLIVGPLAAFTLLEWLRGKSGKARPHSPTDSPRFRRPVVLAVVMLLFMGGNLAPLTMRAYYESPGARISDTPLNAGEDALRAATWAKGHLGRERMWGDMLSTSVLTGFANLRADFGHYRVFANETLNATSWARLQVGDYVVVNRFMVTHRPDFLDDEGPSGPLAAGQVTKFAADPHFARVYDDDTFVVYRVMTRP